MPRVNPIGILNSRAHNVVAGYITDSPLKQQYLHEFLELANKYNVQGPAMNSYFTALHNLEEDKKLINRDSIGRVLGLKKYVRDLAAPKKEEAFSSKFSQQKSTEQEAVDIFVQRLSEMYPRSLRKRISISDQGAVASDKLVRKSWGKNMMIKMNMLLDKLAEFCRPVE